MQDFERLRVWEKAHATTLAVYKATGSFPREELYGLTGQLRRSMTSVPSNLAEGCGRSSTAERARFFDIAFGSACEAEYQLLLARDLGYLAPPLHAELNEAVAEVKRMLAGLLKNLRADC